MLKLVSTKISTLLGQTPTVFLASLSSCGRKNAKQCVVPLAASSCFDCLSKQKSPQLAKSPLFLLV